MTEQRPPVDFDAQKAAERIAELIAEGSVLARGWAERFARRREDGAPAEAATDAAAAAAATDPVAAPTASMSGGDAWSAACDSPSVVSPPAATSPGAAERPGAPERPGAAGNLGAAADPVDSAAADDAPAPAEDVDALIEALRALAARRLGVPAGRIRVSVTLDDTASGTGSGGDWSVARPATAGEAVNGVVVASPIATTERDPIEALTGTLDDLAARARARLSEELGVRLPDIIAEIRFPAGGRPSVRIRPSARAGSGSSGAAPVADLEAIVRRLLLGRDDR